MNHLNNKPMSSMMPQQQQQPTFQMNFNNNIPASSSMFNLGASSSTASQGVNPMANFNLFSTNNATATSNSAMPNIGNTMSSNLWQ